MEIDENEKLKEEWMSKFDIQTERLREALSDECYSFALKNPEIINNWQNQLKTRNVEKSREELAKCYEDIVDFIGSWVDIPMDQKKIIAIWIIGTYFHKKFNTYPYLFFNASKGSGKTRLLRIVSNLQRNGNGEVLNNPSEPVMFRTAQERGLIFDEFESEKSKDKQTMREYLNSCYKKGGVVYRMEKEKQDGKERLVARGYPLFTPVALANINGIEDVLGDRSITLILEKSMNPALVKKIEDFDLNELIKSLKLKISVECVELCSVEYSFMQSKGWNEYISSKYTSIHTLHTIHNSTSIHTSKMEELELEEFYNKVDGSGIYGRNLELFFPLVITARVLGKSIFEDILQIAIRLNSSKKEEEFTESKDAALIEFVSQANKYRFEYGFINDIHREFREFIGSRGEEEDKWITTNWIGLALKRIKLIADRKRVAKGIQVTLNVDKAKEKLILFKSDVKEITNDK